MGTASPPCALNLAATGGQTIHDRHRPQDRSSRSGTTTTVRRSACFCFSLCPRIVLLFRGLEKSDARPCVAKSQVALFSGRAYAPTTPSVRDSSPLKYHTLKK